MFFSSGNAVEQFFDQGYAIGARKVAAIGSATASKLSQYVHVDFVGEGTTKEVAEQFKRACEEGTVLFPISDQSVQTVQQVLDSSKVINHVIYRTVEESVEDIALPDVLVFTSPSNVRAFIKTNGGRDIVSTMVAIGSTTKKELASFGFHKVHTSWKNSELALADIIKPIVVNKVSE